MHGLAYLIVVYLLPGDIMSLVSIGHLVFGSSAHFYVHTDLLSKIGLLVFKESL